MEGNAFNETKLLLSCKVQIRNYSIVTSYIELITLFTHSEINLYVYKFF
jgi:hypothetical protein